MTASIPASAIVSVTPNVISAGGTGLDLCGLFLTSSGRVPIGTVAAFASVAAVGEYFGVGSTEYTAAVTYFNGFEGSPIKPASLVFAQYPTAAVAAYLRGGDISAVALADLQDITGTVIITIDGDEVTTASLDFSSAVSFSTAADVLEAALIAAGATGTSVTYDSVSGAFVVTSPTTGAASTITVAAGTAAAALKLTAATGAVTSQGATAGVPGTAMAAIVAQTQNFATFATLFEPSTDDCVAFAAWAAGAGARFVYVLWDTDNAPTTAVDTTSAGHRITAAGYGSTALVYAPVNGVRAAAFVMGAVASIDFNRAEGRTNLAFRSSANLSPDVTNETVATNLIANSYNFYGAYATANDGFVFLYPGSVTGDFLWLDSLVNEIWLTNALQLAFMGLLSAMTNVPYNAQGYALIGQAAADPINAALNFGAIRAGVTLSAEQRAQINAGAGTTEAATTVETLGYFLQVQPASPSVRAARSSPPINLWYTDGQSIQKIALNSLEVQ